MLTRDAVAGIQTDADHLVPLSAPFATYLDGVTYAINGLVCVHQKMQLLGMARHRTETLRARPRKT